MSENHQKEQEAELDPQSKALRCIKWECLIVLKKLFLKKGTELQVESKKL